MPLNSGTMLSIAIYAPNSGIQGPYLLIHKLTMFPNSVAYPYIGCAPELMPPLIRGRCCHKLTKLMPLIERFKVTGIYGKGKYG